MWFDHEWKVKSSILMPIEIKIVLEQNIRTNISSEYTITDDARNQF